VGFSPVHSRAAPSPLRDGRLTLRASSPGLVQGVYLGLLLNALEAIHLAHFASSWALPRPPPPSPAWNSVGQFAGIRGSELDARVTVRTGAFRLCNAWLWRAEDACHRHDSAALLPNTPPSTTRRQNGLFPLVSKRVSPLPLLNFPLLPPFRRQTFWVLPLAGTLWTRCVWWHWAESFNYEATRARTV